MSDLGRPARADDGSAELAVSVYGRFKDLFGGERVGRDRARREKAAARTVDSVPYGPGRDPKGLGDVFENLTTRLGWDSPLAQHDLLANWAVVSGDENAQHSEPLSIADGVLVVQCDSTAWATQLRHMRHDILVQISERYPQAGVESIRFQGPGAPSWKKGPRSIPGRGPRDTYG
ncbi:DUF721 domain-containing protein [Plantibacter sp. Mn2098]|uniref:DUF721 domain-containing protein n=1 Tax=Plantibacter sp. Mn2098 TaxID=3395266 RepID=UPI003BDC2814